MMVLRRNPYKELEKAIGYRFRKRALLEEALTHRSFRFEGEESETDNQRLEFLGDAVLGLVTAAYVYEELHDKDEGVMTALRSQVTSGKALSRLAKKIAIGDFLRMGRGELQSGGKKRASNLADALEAVIGAVFLDGGIKASQKLFKKLFVPELEALSGDVWADNPKGKLQEVSQRKWRHGPRYSSVRTEGPPHAVVFTVKVALPDGSHATGRGRSKQSAEKNAAENALWQIEGGRRPHRRRRRRRS